MGYEKKYKVTIEADDEVIFIANIKRGESERLIDFDFERAATDIDEAVTVLYYVKEELIEKLR